MTTDKREELSMEQDESAPDKQIKHMVERFLTWKLPESFNPDAGISFKPTFNDHLPEPMKHNPTGTNLFDYTQAEAMVRHMIEDLPGTTVSAVPVGVPNAERFVVPWTPTEAMWGGLARSMMMWLDFGPPYTPRGLLEHLKRTGREIPAWLLEEDEMSSLDHSVSKGTRCVLIYKAMLSDSRREGLRQMVALDEEMGLYGDAPPQRDTPKVSP